MNHPDDTEANKYIAEADDFIEAIWEIAEKYDINLTNNEARWQDGVYLREISEFIGDIRAVYAKWPEAALRDNADEYYMNYWKRGGGE